MKQAANDILYRIGTTDDIKDIADLMCYANSNVIMGLMDLVTPERTMSDCIAHMLALNVGYAKVDNTIVAMYNGKIIGMIFIFPAYPYDYAAENIPKPFHDGLHSFFNPIIVNKVMHSIHSFAVYPDYQNKKIGRALLALAKDKAKAAGSSALTVGTSESNHASHRTYESVGFKVTGSECMTGMDFLECEL